MKYLYLLLLALAYGPATFACPLCNRQVRTVIYDARFYPNLLAMLSAFLVLAILVIVLSVIASRKQRQRGMQISTVTHPSPVPLVTAAVVTGIGLGGFTDGIVLHQLLQVHEMVSNKIAATNYIGKSVNMFWDGVFHLFCLLVTLTGILLLWQLHRRREQVNFSGWLLSGGLLGGWAVFNLVEGIIDHQVLQLHNVVEYAADHRYGNYGFLAGSVVLLLVAMALIRKGIRQRDTTATPALRRL